MNLKEIKTAHDKAYSSGQDTRLKAADDMLFYWVTQWDQTTIGGTSLSYRGQFDVLRKAGRQIIGDLRSNPVQVNFKPKADSREDGADLIDGLYLSADRENSTLEAYDNALGEAVVCGVGAWELYTEYASNRAGDEHQVIKRRPVHEANNNCFWDPNAKRLDKSDARYVSILEAYSPDGYKTLIEELTGEETDIVPSSFSQPEQSYTFPWISSNNDIIYVCRFYCRKRVKDKVVTLSDPLGQPLALRASDIVDVMDDLIDEGYEVKTERVIERWEVRMYLVSGAAILNGEMGDDDERVGEVIAGENIPVIPTYGERAFVEGQEVYEGVTRLAKDPQRLRNFQMSYLADIVSRSPRPKPIFNPEQVQGFEFMYEENGSDNSYPYMLMNRTTANGELLPVGPASMMPEQQIPTALIASIELSRQAVEDVANPGLPQDIADPDLSGKAISALTNRLDQQSIVYQQNYKHAKRRDAEVWASMAVEVNDSPRTVTLTLPDGTTKTQQIMQMVLDKDTGRAIVLNDLTNMEFDVYADIGPSYASKKEQTIEQLGKMAESLAAIDPTMTKMLILKQLSMVDGIAMDDIRKYARKQLIMVGGAEPETDEEIAMVEQMQSQPAQPDANMLMAQAEMEKAKAAQMNAQREALKDQASAQNAADKLIIDQYKAQTDRASVEVDAARVGADIEYTKVRTNGQRMDNMSKAGNAFRSTASTL
jgi:hypothetical protein